jgi:AraC family transcriptional regulator
VLVDQDRVSVGIDEHEVRRPMGRFVGGGHRAHYGVPPRRFSVGALRDARRRDIEALFDPSLESHRVARLPPGANPDGFSVRLRDVPARRVADARVHRPYEGDRVPTVAQGMLAWARERGLADCQWLGFQWDDPEIVALEQCRYDAGLEIPHDRRVGGEVSVTEFPAMKLAEVDVVGPLDLELRALDWIYSSWLPTSGWAPDHQPVFEAWNGEPFAHGTTHFDLRVQLAVVDAALPP